MGAEKSQKMTEAKWNLNTQAGGLTIHNNAVMRKISLWITLKNSANQVDSVGIQSSGRKNVVAQKTFELQ